MVAMSNFISASSEHAPRLRTRECTTRALHAGPVEKGGCDAGRAERSNHAGRKRRTETSEVREQTENRGTEPERHVQKCRVSAHREPSTLRWCAPNRFDAKTGINERVAESGQCGSGQGQRKRGREPD